MNTTMKLTAIATTMILGSGATASAADRYAYQRTAYGYQPPVYRAANYCPPTSVNYHVSYQQPAPVACPPQPCAPVAPCPPTPPCNQCGSYYGGVNQYPAHYGPVNTAPVNYGVPAPYQPNPYPYAPYGQNNNNREHNSNTRGIAERTDLESRKSVTTNRSDRTSTPFLR